MARQKKASSSAKNPLVYKADHPLIEHLLTLMRDANCPHAQYRTLMKQIYILLAYEAMRVLPAKAIPVEVTTPYKQKAVGSIIDSEDMAFIVAVRSGLAPFSALLEFFPRAPSAHVFFERREEGSPRDFFIKKWPKEMQRRYCFVVYPMIASGRIVQKILNALKKERGHLQNVVIVCVVCSPEGVKLISDNFKEVPIVTAALDPTVTKDNKIWPGIGDAGDRLYDTGV